MGEVCLRASECGPASTASTALLCYYAARFQSFGENVHADGVRIATSRVELSLAGWLAGYGSDIDVVPPPLPATCSFLEVALEEEGEEEEDEDDEEERIH